MYLNHLLEIIVIGAASNLDNAGVGIAYGVRGIRINKSANLTIAVISFIMTLLAGVMGSLLSVYVPTYIARYIGALVIVSVGIYVLCQPFLQKKQQPVKTKSRNLLQRILRQPEEADLDQSKSISINEALLLGLALGINALAGGFDAGVTHLNVMTTSIAVGVFSFLLLGITDYIARKYTAVKLDQRATLLSGVLLIVIGIHQIG